MRYARIEMRKAIRSHEVHFDLHVHTESHKSSDKTVNSWTEVSRTRTAIDAPQNVEMAVEKKASLAAKKLVLAVEKKAT